MKGDLCGRCMSARVEGVGIHCNACVARSNLRKEFREQACAAVHRAIARGELPKLDGSIACDDCGGRARDYDHRDYSKPLLETALGLAIGAYRGPKDLAEELDSERFEDRP